MNLPANPTNAEIAALVRQWMSDLADERYAEALSRVPAEESQNWTASLLQAVIAGYGLPEPHPKGTVYRVTAPPEAAPDRPTFRVDRDLTPPHALAYIEQDLPLNGAWSDLTATFLLRECQQGTILQLEEVHVF